MTHDDLSYAMATCSTCIVADMRSSVLMGVVREEFAVQDSVQSVGAKTPGSTGNSGVRTGGCGAEEIPSRLCRGGVPADRSPAVAGDPSALFASTDTRLWIKPACSAMLCTWTGLWRL